MIDFFSSDNIRNGPNQVRFAPTPIILSPETWLQKPSDGCSCSSCLSRLDKDNISIPVIDYRYPVGIIPDEPKPDHFYFLCDNELQGYALNERRWGKIPLMTSAIRRFDNFQYRYSPYRSSL
jgi:hypothetical protein